MLGVDLADPLVAYDVVVRPALNVKLIQVKVPPLL